MCLIWADLENLWSPLELTSGTEEASKELTVRTENSKHSSVPGPEYP